MRIRTGVRIVWPEMTANWPRTAVLACLATLAGLASSCRSGGKTSEGERPNIIFIMTDDHTTQAMSCYGGLIGTPNLDRIAKEGMLFRNCFVTNAVCGPSRATILTGVYNHLNGMTDNASVFDSTQLTYPQLLHENGYQTAVIGKWHLGTLPVGFDHYSILPNQGEYYRPEFIEDGRLVQEEGYVTDVITDKAIEFLKGREKDKPFFMIYQHKAPHRNWMPAPRHLGKYDDRVFPEPATLLDDFQTRGRAAREQLLSIGPDLWDAWDMKLVTKSELDSLAAAAGSVEKDDSKQADSAQANDQTGDKIRLMQVYNRLTPEEKEAWGRTYDRRVEEYRKLQPQGDDLIRWKYQQYMRDYMACVDAVDENVGRLMDYLEQTGQLNNTIIVYTSDQGFFLGEHGFFDKRFMYEEVQRTPLLVRYPPAVRGGTETDAFAVNIDFAPTLLDYAGVKIPRSMQGVSLRPVLEQDGETPSGWRDAVYYHYYEYPSWHMVKRHYGIRTEQYKLIHFYNDIDEWELYDLQQDPQEINNVYGDPAYREVIPGLKEQLKDLQEQYRDTNPTEQPEA